MSRELGPPLYAEFSILYGLLIALSRPLWTLSSAITRVAVSGRMSGYSFDEINRFSLKLSLIVSLIIGISIVAFSPIIRDFLKLNSLFPFFLIGVTLFIWSVCGVLRGLFASVELFSVVSYTSIAELFIRAVAGIVLVLAGFKIAGALGGSLIGAMVLFFTCWLNRSKLRALYTERQQGEKNNLEGFIWIIAKVFFITIPVGFFLELDLLLIKRLLSPEEAGVYAAAALIGKALLMFSTLAAVVIYPRLIEQKLNKKGFAAFLWGIGITVLLFTSGYIFVEFFGEPFIGLLFGDKYVGVVELTPRYILALVPLALHLQVTNYKGAIGGWVEGIWLWLILGGYFVFLESSSASIDSYLWAIFVFHLVTAPLSSIILFLRNKKLRGQSSLSI